MLKLRLKRLGRKQAPFYRLVIMEHSTRRDGRPIDEVGYYNPINKQSYLNKDKVVKWLTIGVKPTQTVKYLLQKADIINF